MCLCTSIFPVIGEDIFEKFVGVSTNNQLETSLVSLIEGKSAALKLEKMTYTATFTILIYLIALRFLSS